MLNWTFAFGGICIVNLGWIFLRLAIGLALLTLLVLSQRFWYRAIWRFASHLRHAWMRVSVRLLWLAMLALTVSAFADALRMSQQHLIPRGTIFPSLLGLWYFSAAFAYISVKAIHGFERLWRWLHYSSTFQTQAPPQGVPLAKTRTLMPADPVDFVADPSRRYFFRSATAFAGAAPFLTALYGFAAERLRYQVHRVEIPIANLPPALDGLRIAQLSDIHLSGYMSREDVRRAVDMANELSADLAVVTGDFITGAGDPIADCIEELRQMRAPLGIWGCNGNHEIYAKAEATAEFLFAQAGMKLLRQENAQLSFNGAPFNLIGVDYQRERTPNGGRLKMLSHIEPLVRRDVPNILLSHNPNAFNRAAELGIELTLSGHTHGGQVKVEILDHSFSPARFITDYIAGLYHRPLFAPSQPVVSGSFLPTSNLQSQTSALYVNRGLGTVGAPVRLGVPPEITLLTLRRA